MFNYWVVGTAVIQIFLLKLAALLLLGDRKVEILHKTQLYRFIFLTPPVAAWGVPHGSVLRPLLLFTSVLWGCYKNIKLNHLLGTV